MKRRDVLKGLTAVAGTGLSGFGPWTSWAWGQQAPQAQPLATPIRGLVRRNGRLMQPIEIFVEHSGSSAIAVTKLNGEEVDRRPLSAGPSRFQVFMESVSAPQKVTVAVSIGDSIQSLEINVLPVHKILVYILPHSHHDLGYTDIQANIETRQIDNLSRAIELARNTANYPEGARFIWNLEVLWSADLFMSRKSQAEKQEFIDAVKRGWLNINGMYANELTGLCRPEELIQLFRYSGVLAKQCGVKVDSAMLSDVPGYTWGTITAMAQAGIRYFSSGPNGSDRIGSLRVTWHDKPFWAISPSGKEQVLVWMPGHGYGIFGAPDITTVAVCQQYLDSIDFPYSISYFRWSGHGDNALPDPKICEFVKSWNEQYEWPKFAISSTSEAFSTFEKRHGNELPKFKGDLTPYWEDGAGSSALETAINRNSADRITQAAALAAMSAKGVYHPDDFNEAWRNVLLYSEHTWGAGGSVRDPEAPMTTKQWAGKRQFALDGESESKQLLDTILRSRGAGDDVAAIEIHNTASWPRTQLVFLTREQSTAGDHVKDSHGKPVPSQRLSTGELAFLAQDVPALGSARFRLSSDKPHEPAMRASVKDGVLENGIVRARLDLQSGNLIELVLIGKSANLINAADGEAANEYLYVEGRDFAEIWNEQKQAAALGYRPTPLDGPDVGSIQKVGAAHITVEEAGPLVASLRIESSAPGCNRLTRRVRLIAGADWLEMSNLVDKKRAPVAPAMESDPEKGVWANYGGKESLHFAFPFAVPDGTMHMDIPLANMRPEADQLPGSSKNWLPVGRWIDVANAHHGVTWVTLDAPLVEIGEISATLPGSQNNPLLWRDHIQPTQKLYSWIMNNLWETNYRAYQEGIVEFRYAVRAHTGYDPAEASRFSIGLSQPLLASTASSAALQQPLLRIEPADVLALTVKPSEDDAAWIVRLFGASGEDRIAKLHWSAAEQPKLWLSDTSERPIEPLDGGIHVAGWDLVTIRAERA